MWMAGGGVKGGVSVGTTDELGSEAVDDPFHVKHLHATMLHQMGLDPNRLTYFYGGLNQKLVGVEAARADSADIGRWTPDRTECTMGERRQAPRPPLIIIVCSDLHLGPASFSQAPIEPATSHKSRSTTHRCGHPCRGRSSRMGRDKPALEIGGRTLL